MKIFDSHTHVDEFDAFGWVDPPEKIVALMDEAHIQKAVIMTYCDTPVLKEDGLLYIAEAVQKYPDRLVGYARMNPHLKQKSINLFEEAVRDLGFKGLKFHPESLTTHPYHDACIALIRKAGELNVPTLFHCGDESMSLPLQIAIVAEKCPEAKIILGHMGGYFHVNDAIAVAERYSNIILETSAMPYPDKIREAVSRIGADRVIFGSDGPGCNPALEVKKVYRAGLTDTQLTQVLSENFEQLMERAGSRSK